MRELIKIVIFHEQEIIFISISVTQRFVTSYLKSIIYVELRTGSEAIQLCSLHCCVALNLIISTQKIVC